MGFDIVDTDSESSTDIGAMHIGNLHWPGFYDTLLFSGTIQWELDGFIDIFD